MQIIRLILLLAVILALAGCSAGRTAFSRAQKLELDGKLDEAVVKYAEATTAHPEIGEYRVRFLKASEAASVSHAAKGDALLASNRLDDALREYQTAFALNSSYDRARQQSEYVVKLRSSQFYAQEAEEFERNRKPREALRSYQKAIELNSENKEAVAAVDRLLKSKRTKLDGYELNLKSSKPITLKFKDAKIKEVFNILAQLSGINFIYDDTLKDQNVSIYLENATFQQALDIITGVNKLGRKVLNESTIIIYPKTPDKIKQYEELIVQTFYLNKLEAKKAVNLIRTMLQVKKIYVNEDMNALVVRDTPDVIEVCRKILEANDIPDAEVLLEVEVIEVAKGNQEKFGLALSSYNISGNVLTPSGSFFSDTFSPTNTTATAGTTTTTTTQVLPSNLLNVFNWKGFGGFVTVPSATFNFGKTLSNGETLSNPKIRVRNREKAKFNVGTRVPITTTSSPTGGGVSVNVQYVDVGVKVNAEPTIQLSNEISIKLSLEVSSIIKQDTVGGKDSLTTVVTIGTRNLDTILNLRDGETSIIGGLIQDIKSNSKRKVFLLGDIPIIGPLFTDSTKSDDKTELILAITPRIIRAVTVPELDVITFWSGKEDEPSISKPYSSFVQEPDLAVTLQPSGTTSSSTTTPLPVATTSEVSPNITMPVRPSASSSSTTATAPAAVVQPQPVMKPEGPPERISLNFTAPATAKQNEEFKIDIIASDAKDLLSSNFVLVYDPIFLEFVSITEGGLLKKDGKPTTFKYNVTKANGQVSINLSRPSDAKGVNGTGTLATAVLRAKNKGPGNISFMETKFTTSKGTPLETLPYTAVVEIE
jgi:general secretion pathway protein D